MAYFFLILSFPFKTMLENDQICGPQHERIKRDYARREYSFQFESSIHFEAAR
jgi:hypothetical protein